MFIHERLSYEKKNITYHKNTSDTVLQIVPNAAQDFGDDNRVLGVANIPFISGIMGGVQQ